MPIDFSRQTFKEVSAPRTQKCGCGCGQTITKDQLVFARVQTQRGKGESRIIDLEDHYRAWLENAAHQYASAQASKDKAFSNYLKG